MPRRILLPLILLCALPTLSQTAPSSAAAANDLPRGHLLERVPCAQKPEQSYALYLPSNYSPDRRWPIVYSFDPGARGAEPVKLQMAAAEQLGYILAASNNSQNGPWKPQAEAAQAMVDDTRARFSLDDRAVYFAGFSGGARLASQVATLCKCAAGVLLSGAGFSANAAPSAETRFAVFSAVGRNDFNYLEVLPLQAKLAEAGVAHWLQIFEGRHQWAPADAMEQALAWFRLQAIKRKLTPVDAAFVTAQLAQATQHAVAAEASGDVLGAWREYQQIAETFEGLANVAAAKAKAEALGSSKPVRDALKREQDDFAEQSKLEGEVEGAIAQPTDDGDNPGTPGLGAVERARYLRSRSEHEKQPDRARVLHRALSGVFVAAMESGGHYQQTRDFDHAIRAFACAAEVAPDSEWAWRSLAQAHAARGHRKEALATLKHARELAQDKPEFDQWLKTETAFEKLRPLPEFRALTPQ